jgi:CRP-like cAMP-binding protein
MTLIADPRNLIISSMPADARGDLLAFAAERPIAIGAVLSMPGERVETVLFPTAGALSSLAGPTDEEHVEAATIGREGIGNVPSALGSRLATQTLIGQVAGSMLEIAAEPFANIVAASPRVAELVSGFVDALVSQVSWNAACVAMHHVEARCARWLLTAHDRVDADTVELKQEFLAMMLGVQRPSVSIAAQALQEAGCIAYARGTITIVDREALEAVACACYEGIRADYARLVPLGRVDRRRTHARL